MSIRRVILLGRTGAPPSPGLDKSFSSHYTPDFSDAYPDPFMRTGIDAKRKADYLYSKELFFKDIPHIRSLLFNQHKGLDNDLAPNRSTSALFDSSTWCRRSDLHCPKDLVASRFFESPLHILEE
ncbi:hypothetical protein YQE_00736, partial [Dendroctonus ponderosae]